MSTPARLGNLLSPVEIGGRIEEFISELRTDHERFQRNLASDEENVHKLGQELLELKLPTDPHESLKKEISRTKDNISQTKLQMEVIERGIRTLEFIARQCGELQGELKVIEESAKEDEGNLKKSQEELKIAQNSGSEERIIQFITEAIVRRTGMVKQSAAYRAMVLDRLQECLQTAIRRFGETQSQIKELEPETTGINLGENFRDGMGRMIEMLNNLSNKLSSMEVTGDRIRNIIIEGIVAAGGTVEEDDEEY